MTARDFCFWLQGHFELNPAGPLDANQAGAIRKHLALVFVHDIDPSMGPPEHQQQLDAIHHSKLQLGGTDERGNTMRC